MAFRKSDWWGTLGRGDDGKDGTLTEEELQEEPEYIAQSRRNPDEADFFNMNAQTINILPSGPSHRN